MLKMRNKHLRNILMHKKYVRSVYRHYSDRSKQSDVNIPLSNGKNLNISSGQYARLADGCAVATLGDTSVMVTAVSKTKPSPANFLPLVVDYRQKSAAAGRIPTNFLRRELGPSEREILTSRLIDRSLRPLFPEGYNYETQVVCNMLAVDGVNNPDVLAINAASAALAISDIPWNGPVGAVRLGMIDNEVIVNPTRKEIQMSSLNLIVSAIRSHLVVMLEGNADNILQQDLMKAIKQGTKEAQQIVIAIEQMQKTVGIPKREILAPDHLSEEISEGLRSLSEMRVKEIFKNYRLDKLQRDNALGDIRTDVLEKIKHTFPDLDLNLVNEGYNKIVKKIFRDLIFEEDKRCDGREFDEVRDIDCKVNLYRPLHGSAMFQRGQTQVFCTVTLDSAESAMKMDTLAMLTRAGSEFLIFQKILKLEYDYPDAFDRQAKDLVDRFLVIDPTKRLGANDAKKYESIRKHPFFRGVNWDDLGTPPIISDYEECNDHIIPDHLEPGLDEEKASRLHLDLYNEPPVSTPQRKKSEPPRKLTDVTEQEALERLEAQKANPYHGFVEGNLILKQGLVDKKKGLIPRRRMFLLTQGPHLYYVDPATMIFKGEVPMSKDMKTEAKNFKIFYVHTPNRKYHLEDPEGFALEWCKAIDEVKAYYFPSDS